MIDSIDWEGKGFPDALIEVVSTEGEVSKVKVIERVVQNVRENGYRVVLMDGNFNDLQKELEDKSLEGSVRFILFHSMDDVAIYCGLEPGDLNSRGGRKQRVHPATSSLVTYEDLPEPQFMRDREVIWNRDHLVPASWYTVEMHREGLSLNQLEVLFLKEKPTKTEVPDWGCCIHVDF